ncbi:MAG: hypothetical protein M3Q58_01725 [Bacteroidota bacterium]|nr:hypothetical protein [Bacteroidota bacterium]
MKETTDYLDNIMDIVLACRKINGKVGARLKHYYEDDKTIIVKLSGNAQITVPLIIAENGVSQLTKEAIQKIVETFEIHLLI